MSYNSEASGLLVKYLQCDVTIKHTNNIVYDRSVIVGIPADQNRPWWWFKAHIWNLTYWKSDSLLTWNISHTHSTYEQVYSVQMNLAYWRISHMKCVFRHKLVITEYHISCLNKVTFRWSIFSFLTSLSIFCTVVMSLLKVIYSNKISFKISKHYLVNNAMYYEWIMKQTNTSKPWMTFNRIWLYLERCFGHMVSLLWWWRVYKDIHITTNIRAMYLSSHCRYN